MLYFLPILMILFGCYYYDYLRRQRGKLVYWLLLMVILICIAGFRYRMGSDSQMYENYFKWQHSLSQLSLDDFRDTRFAPFYVLLSSSVKSITSDFMALQFAVAIIVNSAVFYFFWKNSRNIFFGILLYYFMLYINLNMEVLREALAVSIFICSWPFFKEGKWGIYYLMAFIAFMFHISAVVLLFLPLLWLPGIRWFFQFGARTWFICIGMIILSFAVNYFFFDFIKLIAFTENIAERAEVYSKTELAGNTLNIGGIIGHICNLVLYPLICMYFINKNQKLKNEIHPKLIFMNLVAVYLALLSIGIRILIRYNNYFDLFTFLLMSDWIFSIIDFHGKKVRFRFLSWLCLFLPLFCVTFYTYYLGNYNRTGTIKRYNMYYPYSSVFDKEVDPDREKALHYKRKL